MRITPDLVRSYCHLFVNRLAYTMQTFRPARETGRHIFFLVKWRATNEPLNLTRTTVRRHLEGKHTIGLYPMNPKSKRSKWVVLDADYPAALEDLRRVQSALAADGITAALELSRRGGHLWVFMESPLLARELRIYFLNLILKLGLPIKDAKPQGPGAENSPRSVEGIEIFPQHDDCECVPYGHAIRGPLGIHQAVNQRYPFEGVELDVREQLNYLRGLPKLREETLHRLIEGKTMPKQFEPKPVVTIPIRRFSGSVNEFRILDHVQARRRSNYLVARCPSCQEDPRAHHLHISLKKTTMYSCVNGCTTEMIRHALGRPKRRSA